MNVEYANVFITSAVAVFLKELNIQLTRKTVNVHFPRKFVARDESIDPASSVAIVMGITGIIHGQIIYSMDQSFAMGVAKAMLPKSPAGEIRGLSTSAICEIANIITGQASIALAGETKKLNITPPVVIRAKDMSLSFLDIPRIALRLVADIGLLEINIALTEKTAIS